MTNLSTITEKTRIECGDLIKIVSPFRKKEDYYLIIDVETAGNDKVNWKALKDGEVITFHQMDLHSGKGIIVSSPTDA